MSEQAKPGLPALCSKSCTRVSTPRSRTNRQHSGDSPESGPGATARAKEKGAGCWNLAYRKARYLLWVRRRHAAQNRPCPPASSIQTCFTAPGSPSIPPSARHANLRAESPKYSIALGRGSRQHERLPPEIGAILEKISESDAKRLPNAGHRAISPVVREWASVRE